jgi:predicted DNA-binding WGR domain protein
LAVLIDTAAHYTNRDVFERYVSRPRILGAFGWRAIQVLSRDWHDEPRAVLDRIERTLQGTQSDAPLAPDEARLDASRAAVSVLVAAEETQKADATRVTSGAGRASAARRFECTEGGSRKFWQIRQQGNEVTVDFGRIGTQGQTQLKQFSNEQRAQQEVSKLVAEKLKRGYIETLG